MRFLNPSRCIILLLLLAANTLTAQDHELPRIDSLINQFYKSLSFTDSAWKKAEEAKVFFFDGGKIVANFGKEPQVWTLKQYISNVRENISKQSVLAVEEKEIFQSTDVFGKVAQRLSTYEVRFKTKDREMVRNGINLIQLLKVNGQWKVYSLVWDRESDQLKIPAAFKPN
jgi:hypothetical protein